MQNQQDGTFSAPNVAGSSLGDVWYLQVADLDNDGDQDIVYNQRQTVFRVAWLENLGNGTFATAQTLTDSDYAGMRDIKVHDLNGDGYLDILLTSDIGTEAGIVWLKNNRDASFSDYLEIESDVTVSSYKMDVFDIDADGDLDVFSGDISTGDILWYENDGEGNFGASNKVSGGHSSPVVILGEDIDGDGDEDIVFNELGDDQGFYWLQNDGFNNFDTYIEITPDSLQLTDLFAIDIDGDSDVDLLASDAKTNKAKLFVNDEDGNFSEITHEEEFGQIREIYAVDLNNDGDLDVISVDQSDHQVVWYENEYQTELTEVRPIAARVGGGIEIYGSRFSSDGSDIISVGGEQVVTDLVVSENKITATLTNALDPGYVDVAISGTNGTDTLAASLFVIEPTTINFGLQQNVPTGSSEGANGIDVGDLDGDGYVDIVAAHYASDEVTWYKNDQNGEYGSATVLTSLANGAQDVQIADFNKDGYQDILYAQFNDQGRIGWFKNDGLGNFTAQSEISVAGQLYQIRDVHVGDLDGDGYLDVIAASISTISPAIVWFRNNRDGTFESEGRVIEESKDLPSTKIHAEDIDGDGDLDILSPIYDPKGGYLWYLNDGLGNFGARQALGILYNYPWAVETGDIDGDGFPDLITNEISGERRTRWYRNNRSGEFTTPGTEITSDSLSIVDLLTVDIDGDGDLDILAANPNDKNVIRFMNDGDGNFTQFTVTDAAYGARNVVVGDVDNDGTTWIFILYLTMMTKFRGMKTVYLLQSLLLSQILLTLVTH